MDFVRIGDKVINRSKIDRTIDKILELRCKGMSQQDVANELNCDRTFISRLEGLGEVRKGSSIAVVGFPVGNKQQIEQIAREEGVDFTMVLDDRERWAFVKGRDGLEVLDDLLQIIHNIRRFDTVILMGSDRRLELMRSMLDKEVIPIVLGQSPIVGDVQVDAVFFRDMLRALKGDAHEEVSQ